MERCHLAFRAALSHIAAMTVSTMAFSGGHLDHCDHERTADSLKKILQDDDTRVVLFHDYLPAITPNGRLLLVHPKDLEDFPIFDPGMVFLGRDSSTGRNWFAAHLQDPGDAIPPEQFADLRRIAGTMEPQELAIVGRAKSLIDWHGSHAFCAKCGERSAPAKGAALRVCTGCKTEHYPRISPVAIMLIEHEDHILLGRQAFWPAGSYSALAGFISPGESLEEGCAREIKEEVGLDVSNIRYLMSQSWPFPSQLMLGLISQASNRDITIDKQELENAQWFSRAEVQAVWDKTGDAFVRPPAFTIAHQLVRAWLESGK